MSDSNFDVRLTPECVAKLFAALRTRNYRIRMNAVLNRCCVLALIFESTLRISVAKIVCNRIRPTTDMSAGIAGAPSSGMMRCAGACHDILAEGVKLGEASGHVDGCAIGQRHHGADTMGCFGSPPAWFCHDILAEGVKLGSNILSRQSALLSQI